MEDRQYAALVSAMVQYDAGSPKRIQHLLKVHSFARTIGILEGLDAETQYILETAAIIHDIGIRSAEEKYGSSAGYLQEKEGPEEAEKVLEKTGGYTEEQKARICWLVGHHHTYTDITGLDYRILVEADFLVNLYESGERYRAILAAEKNIFQTDSGKMILHQMFKEKE